jgi:sugar lactone lactonase YvrE
MKLMRTKQKIITTMLVAGACIASCGTVDSASAQQLPKDYIEGPVNAEDLVLIPGTAWVVASGMAHAPDPKGALYLINSEDRTWQVQYPGPETAAQHDATTYPACATPPIPETFSGHGLAVRPGRDGQHTLYAIGHGGREAVEVFHVDAGGVKPHFTWVGCVPTPEGLWPNAVVALPGGGIAITSTYDPRDQEGSFARLRAGEPTGVVAEWKPDVGWHMLPRTELGGNNGLEISTGGEHLYLNGWADRIIIRVSRQSPEILTGDRAQAMLDNLRFSPDGTLLATGQTERLSEFAACAFSDARVCRSGFVVLEVDPETLESREVIRSSGDAKFGAGTTALKIGDEIWVGTYRGERIAIFPNEKRMR